MNPNYCCGFVALVGRPNVGKSTLLNSLLGQKISITSTKPQTTRHRILGIKSTAQEQVIYVDTPGLHLGGERAINRFMNREASGAVEDVDVIIFLVDRTKWTDEDDNVLQKLQPLKTPVILAINKTDQLEDKTQLLPHIEFLQKKMAFVSIVPISALKNEGVSALENTVSGLLPESPPFFPEDQITDRSERFFAAELIREKLIRNLGQEIPHRLTVEIESFKQESGMYRINAIIWVEKPGQKGIIIGKNGSRLKIVGEAARKDMEKTFDHKVFLQMWVKVKKGWSNDERAMQSLGFKTE
ncbi:MAG: GTPase Era [Gammaproteobacteria bacterium SG8_11]|nr:MAG: GTPase Era [Gammaproteobacteria bacterium SG8_11]